VDSGKWRYGEMECREGECGHMDCAEMDGGYVEMWRYGHEYKWIVESGEKEVWNVDTWIVESWMVDMWGCGRWTCGGMDMWIHG
jgi:hypothetical protein